MAQFVMIMMGSASSGAWKAYIGKLIQVSDLLSERISGCLVSWFLFISRQSR